MVTFVAKQLVEHNAVARAQLGVRLGKFDTATAISVGLQRPAGHAFPTSFPARPPRQ